MLLSLVLVQCHQDSTTEQPTSSIKGIWHPTKHQALELEITDSTIIQRVGYPIVVGYSIRLESGSLEVGKIATYRYTTPTGAQSALRIELISLTPSNCEIIAGIDPVKLRR